MRNGPFTIAYWAVVMLGMAGRATAQDAVAQDKAARQPSAREQLQHIHTPQSID
jgi:hypothetical protein